MTRGTKIGISIGMAVILAVAIAAGLVDEFTDRSTPPAPVYEGGNARLEVSELTTGQVVIEPTTTYVAEPETNLQRSLRWKKEWENLGAEERERREDLEREDPVLRGIIERRNEAWDEWRDAERDLEREARR
jgi:hypothetical protein